jgi:hypothetical protein
MLGTRLLLLLDISCGRDASLRVLGICSASDPLHCIAWILFGFNFMSEPAVTVRERKNK